MRLKKISTIILLFLSTSVWADQICVSNKAEHEKQKDKLPDIFQANPIYLGNNVSHWTVSVTAAVRIDFLPKGVKLTSDVCQKKVCVLDEVKEVSKICIDQDSKTYKIVFTNSDEASGGFDAKTVRLKKNYPGEKVTKEKYLSFKKEAEAIDAGELAQKNKTPTAEAAKSEATK